MYNLIMTPKDLRAALDHLHWSQAELARRIDYAPNTVNRWAQGEIPIPGWLTAYLDAMTGMRDLAERCGVIKP